MLCNRMTIRWMFYKWCLIGIKRILNNSVFRYFWEVIEVICFNCGGQPTGNLMYFASVPFLWKVSFRRILKTSRIYLMYSLVELFLLHLRGTVWARRPRRIEAKIFLSISNIFVYVLNMSCIRSCFSVL